MHFGDVSETNVRNTPRQSRSAHAFVFTKKKTKTIWKPFLWLSRLLGNHCGGFSFNYNRNVAVKRHRVSLSWYIRLRGSLSNYTRPMQGFSLCGILKPGSHGIITIIMFLERRAPLVYSNVRNITGFINATILW